MTSTSGANPTAKAGQATAPALLIGEGAQSLGTAEQIKLAQELNSRYSGSIQGRSLPQLTGLPNNTPKEELVTKLFEDLRNINALAGNSKASPLITTINNAEILSKEYEKELLSSRKPAIETSISNAGTPSTPTGQNNSADSGGIGFGMSGQALSGGPAQPPQQPPQTRNDNNPDPGGGSQSSLRVSSTWRRVPRQVIWGLGSLIAGSVFGKWLIGSLASASAPWSKMFSPLFLENISTFFSNVNLLGGAATVGLAGYIAGVRFAKIFSNSNNAAYKQKVVDRIVNINPAQLHALGSNASSGELREPRQQLRNTLFTALIEIGRRLDSEPQARAAIDLLTYIFPMGILNGKAIGHNEDAIKIRNTYGANLRQIAHYGTDLATRKFMNLCQVVNSTGKEADNVLALSPRFVANDETYSQLTSGSPLFPKLLASFLSKLPVLQSHAGVNFYAKFKGPENLTDSEVNREFGGVIKSVYFILRMAEDYGNTRPQNAEQDGERELQALKKLLGDEKTTFNKNVSDYYLSPIKNTVQAAGWAVGLGVIGAGLGYLAAKTGFGASLMGVYQILNELPRYVSPSQWF